MNAEEKQDLIDAINFEYVEYWGGFSPENRSNEFFERICDQVAGTLGKDSLTEDEACIVLFALENAYPESGY